MIQFLLISKTPTNGHQFGPTRFGRVRWRYPENAGDPSECTDAQSRSTVETLPNSWQTTSLSNRDTDLRLAESAPQSNGAEPRSPCPCRGSDRASRDASCRTAILMTLPRRLSIDGRRRAWKAVPPSIRNGQCHKQNGINPRHRARVALPTRPTTGECQAGGLTNHGRYAAFPPCLISARTEGDSPVARPYCVVKPPNQCVYRLCPNGTGRRLVGQTFR